ncbi:MAG TPA: TlpA disulfide reductase family protein [Polyangia bacterium]|nr:TlpA disulfide reductase family protein [Polyangia bacterium]
MRILLALAVLSLSAPSLAEVSKGQRAPDFSLPSLRGPRVSLAGLRGKVVIVDFWAQWCEPCKKELPQLDKLSKDYASRGVVILAVNIDKERENAERLVKQLGLTLPVLLDPTGAVASTYDLPKMPTSFVIDKKGLVRFVHDGFEGSGDVDRFRSELDELTR